jgi:hypothetical protein
LLKAKTAELQKLTAAYDGIGMRALLFSVWKRLKEVVFSHVTPRTKGVRLSYKQLDCVG